MAIQQPIHIAYSMSSKIGWPNDTHKHTHTSISLLHVFVYTHTPILTSIDSISLISSRDHVFPMVNAPFWLRLVLYNRILLRFSVVYKVSIAYLLYIHIYLRVRQRYRGLPTIWGVPLPRPPESVCFTSSKTLRWISNFSAAPNGEKKTMRRRE